MLTNKLAVLQTSWLAGWLTAGKGFTITAALILEPLQTTLLLVKVGLTVKLANCAAVIEVTGIPEIVLVPLAGSPVMFELLLVQLNVVPDTLLDNTMGTMAEPVQTCCACGVNIAWVQDLQLLLQ